MPIELQHSNRSDVAAAWREAGHEPGLGEVLADPLVHLVMRRDGVTLPELEGVVAAARARLRRGVCCLSAL